MGTAALTQRAVRRLPTRPVPRWRGSAHGWALITGLALAAGAGLMAGGGDWKLALALVVVPAFVLVATAAPERTALGLIVTLPFFIYPASVGGFSLFLAVPTFGLVSVVLLTRRRASLATLRHDLPAVAFAILLAVAVVAAGLSTNPTRGMSRVLYLAMFGLFAFAVASALASGRLSRESVAKALLVGGGLAGAAVAIQFVAQFGAGKGTVLDWLYDVESLFAGERAAVLRKSNWVIDDLDVVRGIFPFMSPPAAGQFLMFSLIGGVWLRRERRATTPASSALEVALLLLVAVALLFTFSRQSWLGAGAGIVALGLIGRPSRTGRSPLGLLVVAIPVLVALTLVPVPGAGGSFGDYLLSAGDTSSESTDTRLDLWDQTIDLIPEHAVVGVGPGLIETLAPGYNDRPFYAHNVFLDAVVELGIAGVLALIATFVLGLRAAYRRRAALALALLTAYLVAGLFDDVLYTPRNGILLAVAFALVAGPRKPGG